MKILIANEAFLGDLILSTSVLKPLKKAFPDCKIGFLTGSWARLVIEDHVDVDWIHSYDQVCFNRSRISRKKKKKQEIRTKKIALKEIQSIHYDLAIDLHSYYKENSAHFLYQTEIPIRLGYWNRLKPYFYTHFVFWEWWLFHMLENHIKMLKELPVANEHLEHFQPSLEYRQRIESPLAKEFPENYFLVHVGTGEMSREWELKSWKELAKKLDTLNVPLVFIGKGKNEKSKTQAIVKELRNGLDYCDRFSWRELIGVIQKAQFLVGLESMAGHLAAAFGIPAVLIYAGESLCDWRPYHPFCHVIKPAEIYLKQKKMLYPKEPIHMITPDEVFSKAMQVLSSHRLIQRVS